MLNILTRRGIKNIMDKLNPKQRMFVEAFDGDIPTSMRIAGYEGADGYLKKRGEELLSDPLIQEAIKHRDLYHKNMRKAIASRQERQELWSNIMKNEDPFVKEEVDANGIPIPIPKNIALPLRLKASELLGKSEADFVDKVDMNVQHSLSDIIMQSYKIEDNSEKEISIEAIEAEYYRAKKANELPVMDVTDQLSTEAPQSIEDLI